ncbi:hypothetical protein [Corallococcus terminator]|uniref:Uncharacterized protein n=1 Tax=Corallococcus terminator TaxID=2316733 RepID=A0A3A8J9A1_9BACT|nr:hypothetical protein [Corallococcus terminator]RKG88804.1 hypothetical protein D7V88_13630 [Corallococcus terminator]
MAGCWLLAGCGGGDVKVRGHVTLGGGHQAQGLTDGKPALGGDGTVTATRKVRASLVGTDGALKQLAEADVESGGGYTLELDATYDRMVIEAVDAKGVTVASALLDSTQPAAGEDTRTAPPINTESSLEAEVFVRMVKDGTSPASVDTVDLRTRINAEQAAAVRGEASDEMKAGSVKALAAAMRAAQDTRLKAYARAGSLVNREYLFSVSQEAAAKLDAALDAGGESSTEAYDAFFAAVREATKEANAQQEQQAEREAGVAFRFSVKAKAPAGSGIADASVRSAAALEGRATEASVRALLEAASATDAAKAQADTAATALRTGLAGAPFASGASQAWANYSAQLTFNGRTSVVGTHLGVTADTQLTFQDAVNASAGALITLDSALSVIALQAGEANSTVLSDAIVNAFSTYDAALRLQGNTRLDPFGAKAASGVELLVISAGAFRGE